MVSTPVDYLMNALAEPPSAQETDLDEKLASTDSNELRAAVEEHMHTFSSQYRMSQAMAAVSVMNPSRAAGSPH